MVQPCSSVYDTNTKFYKQRNLTNIYIKTRIYDRKILCAPGVLLAVCLRIGAAGTSTADSQSVNTLDEGFEVGGESGGSWNNYADG